ncbi:MAG: type II secretion system protein N [Limnohabitans sp.]
MNDTAQEGAPAPMPHRLVRALGAMQVAAPDAPETGRLQLVGVIAGTSGQGSALIAVDGQLPKAYRVGQSVGEGLVLQRLSPKRAQLGATMNGPRLQDLQLPADSTP